MDPLYLASLNRSNVELDLLTPEWQAAIVTLYSGTALISISANLLAIFVIFSQERFTTEIWKYLINLSIADIFMALFSIPFTYTPFMLGKWIFPNWMCPAVQFAQMVSVMVSVYTLVIIGFDR